MPKKIDQAERRKQIASAVWQVILKHGIDKTSIQQIADEAGISVGQIQHHFTSKDQLIHFAMELVLEQMGERAKSRSAAFQGTREEALRRYMKFLIPVNGDEITECRVWIAFLGISFSNPELLALQRKLDLYSRHLMGIIVDLMYELGYLTPEHEREAELEMVYGFIEGLTIHAAQSPERYPEEKVISLVNYYLRKKRGGADNG